MLLLQLLLHRRYIDWYRVPYVFPFSGSEVHVRRGQPRGVVALGPVVIERVALAVVAGLLLPLNALARLELLWHVRPRVVVARSAAARTARAAGLGARRPHFPLGPSICL